MEESEAMSKRLLASTLATTAVLSLPASAPASPAQPKAPKLAVHHVLPSLSKQMRRAARVLREPAAPAAAPVASYPPVLQRIAACESGGNPRAIGGGGAYRGLFQFTLGTWRGVGGSGDPVNASPAEQYRRAAILLARSGPGQWPVCG
jgi:hypothetical protein